MLLDTINSPEQLRLRSPVELRIIADELRAETVRAVSVTGGHLGASLGVVELTVALHYVFDTPRDRLIWDVGHQAYPHKILTNRRHRIHTLRAAGGLSGFTKRSESEFDPFGAAHAATSISAALGMAMVRDLAGRSNRIVAVIGDGSLSAGMAYEALNNAGAAKSRLIVILNDNEMSIAPPVGAMSAYLTRLTRTPDGWRSGDFRSEGGGARTGRAGTIFEEIGFQYMGPIDGHDFGQLLPTLEKAPRFSTPARFSSTLSPRRERATGRRRRPATGATASPSSTSLPGFKSRPRPRRHPTPRCSAKPS